MGSVEEWFASDKDYQKGVAIYNEIGNNKALKRRFAMNDSNWNKEKLEHELSKYLPIQKVNKVQEIIVKEEIPVEFEAEISAESTHKKTSILFADLPESLRSVLEEANLTYRKLCLLKTNLNEIPDADEKKAFSIQTEMDRLFKVNAACWSKIDHFFETGVVIEDVQHDFSQLNPVQLLRKQQLQYQKVSKGKTAIEKLMEGLNTDNQVLKQKVQKKLNKAKTKLVLDEGVLLELNKLIDE